jgi:ribose-phosphate pyrophosphokinase
VQARGITGEVRGRMPLIVDDMISTGATIDAAAEALLAAGCLSDMVVVATHALLVGPAIARLHDLPLRRLLTTDRVALPDDAPLPLEIVGLAPLLVAAITRLHEERPLRDLIGRG